MGKTIRTVQDFFPPKDLVYFWLKTRHPPFKNSDFFSKDNFPAKETFSWPLLKAQTLPAKRLSLIFDLFLSPFKAKIFPPKDLFPFFEVFTTSRLLKGKLLQTRPDFCCQVNTSSNDSKLLFWHFFALIVTRTFLARVNQRLWT